MTEAPPCLCPEAVELGPGVPASGAHVPAETEDSQGQPVKPRDTEAKPDPGGGLHPAQEGEEGVQPHPGSPGKLRAWSLGPKGPCSPDGAPRRTSAPGGMGQGSVPGHGQSCQG